MNFLSGNKIYKNIQYIESVIFLLIIVFIGTLSAQTKVVKDTVALASLPVDSNRMRTIDNNAFSVGEQLVFSVDYGFVHAGTAIMTVEKIVTVQGRDCYYITSLALSSYSFSFFFKVEDRVVSYLDRKGLFSWRTEKHIKEGKYHAERLYDLDQWRGVSRNVIKGDTLMIPRFVQDALSALYFSRTQSFKEGDEIQIPHFDNGKLYNMAVRVGKKEKIKVPAGTFQTILIEPLMASEGIFKHKGQMQIWLTDDQRRIPVKMTSKIIIGNIGAHLTSIKTDYGK